MVVEGEGKEAGRDKAGEMDRDGVEDEADRDDCDEDDDEVEGVECVLFCCCCEVWLSLGDDGAKIESI